ncbi:MAG: DUF4915 domain-containing protein [Acidimicrobiales bacterium]
MATTWRDALARDARLLVSGFGKWGGGLYDLTSGTPRALDDLATSGIALGGGRLWRVLRAPGEQTSTCEILCYDARGARSYQRIDAIHDPHDVRWHDGALHISSSWDDAVWRLSGDTPELVWARGTTIEPGPDGGRRADRGGALGATPDLWHVNSLTTVDGALHVCAFGRSERHKGWKSDDEKCTGFVHDLSTGRDVLTGLAHPHSPRRKGDRWYVCESAKGTLTELDAAGRVLRRAAVRRFTRGLALVGDWALVGGNAHRESDLDRAEVVVVDLRSFEVADRIPMPCLEVYDILAVPPLLAGGAALGFGANPARAVEQHRNQQRPADRRPTPDDVAVCLVTPRTADELASMGRRLDADDADGAARCGVRGELPAEIVAGTASSVRLDVVNRTSRPLGTVLPRPVKIGARWFPLDPAGGDRQVVTLTNPLLPLPRVVPPGYRTPVDVVVEAPPGPGRYLLRVALHQPKLGWFGVRAQAEVTVVAGPGDGPSSRLGPERGEEDDVADGVPVGEQHDQPVHADAQAARGG